MSKLSKVLLSAQNIIFRIKLQHIFWKKRCIFLLDLFKPQILFMKKIISLLILFCLLISCERKEPNFSDEMIERLAFQEKIDGQRIPSIYTSFNLYFLTNNREVCLTNNSELSFLYKQYYSNEFSSLKVFFDAVLNHEFILDKKRFKKPVYIDSFKLKLMTEKEYSNLGFDNFLKKYSKETASKRLALNRAIIKEGEQSTIEYILFKNGYDINSDCYLGIDFIRKREDSFK